MVVYLPDLTTSQESPKVEYRLTRNVRFVAKDNDIAFVQTGSYPVRDGNSVRALVDGRPAFRRICETIETAQHSVWATITFMWSSFVMPDQRGTTFDVLQRAAERGVDVRLIFWRPGPRVSGTQTQRVLGLGGTLRIARR